jgi:hypothetical protein
MLATEKHFLVKSLVLTQIQLFWRKISCFGTKSVALKNNQLLKEKKQLL